VFCQKARIDPLSLGTIWDNIKNADYAQIDTLYYLSFFILIFLFFAGNRMCREGQIKELKEVD
jgi:hypothetical protein